jgi:hypothetical protein
LVNLSEVAMVAAITVSVAGVSYAAFHDPALTGSVQATAARATCHTVNEAIVAYLALNDRPPRVIADLNPFVNGDITTYRIEQGVAAGPGCQK